MEFHAIPWKIDFFIDVAQLHGNCHSCEIRLFASHCQKCWPNITGLVLTLVC